MFLPPSCVLSYTNLERTNNFYFPCEFLSLCAYLGSYYNTDFHYCGHMFFKVISAQCTSAWKKKIEKTRKLLMALFTKSNIHMLK